MSKTTTSSKLLERAQAASAARLKDTRVAQEVHGLAASRVLLERRALWRDLVVEPGYLDMLGRDIDWVIGDHGDGWFVFAERGTSAPILLARRMNSGAQGLWIAEPASSTRAGVVGRWAPKIKIEDLADIGDYMNEVNDRG